MKHTFLGKRSENDFVVRSACLGNTMLCLAPGLSSNYWGLRTKLACSKHQNLFSSYERGKRAWNWFFQSGWKSGSSFSTAAWFKGELYFDSHRVLISLTWADTAWWAASPGRGQCCPRGNLSFYKCLQLISTCPHAEGISIKSQHSPYNHPPESMSMDKRNKI